MGGKFAGAAALRQQKPSAGEMSALPENFRAPKQVSDFPASRAASASPTAPLPR